MILRNQKNVTENFGRSRNHPKQTHRIQIGSSAGYVSGVPLGTKNVSCVYLAYLFIPIIPKMYPVCTFYALGILKNVFCVSLRGRLGRSVFDPVRTTQNRILYRLKLLIQSWAERLAFQLATTPRVSNRYPKKPTVPALSTNDGHASRRPKIPSQCEGRFSLAPISESHANVTGCAASTLR